MMGMGECVCEQTDDAPGKMYIRCLQPLLIKHPWDLLLHVLLSPLLGVLCKGLVFRSSVWVPFMGLRRKTWGWFGASIILLWHPSLSWARV